MSQTHAITKRHRRQKSHTRGHEGRATQLALRSPEAKYKAEKQTEELIVSALAIVLEKQKKREEREARRKH